MAIDVDKLFKNMATKPIAGKGNNMSAGLYEVTINDMFPKEGENPKKKGDWFITEFTIDQSTSEKNKAGTSASWVLSFNWDNTLDKITMLLYAILGWDVTRDTLNDPHKRTVAEAYARAIAGSAKAVAEIAELAKTDPDVLEYEKGMFNGVRLKLECSEEDYEKDGEKRRFTRFKWAPIPVEETAAA